MRTTLEKIGSYFRRKVSADTGLTPRYPCAICGEQTDPADRLWSPGRRAYIDGGCIPPYVINRGSTFVTEWLETL